MTDILALYRLIRLAWRAYRISKATGGTGYAGYSFRGVPSMCVMVGTGREAWRVTQHAIATFKIVEIHNDD